MIKWFNNKKPCGLWHSWKNMFLHICYYMITWFILWESVCLDCAVFSVIAVSQCENVMYLLWITCHNMWIVAIRKEWNIYHLCAICGKMSFLMKKWNSEMYETLSCHHSHYILWSIVCLRDGSVNLSFIEKTAVIQYPNPKCVQNFIVYLSVILFEIWWNVTFLQFFAMIHISSNEKFVMSQLEITCHNMLHHSVSKKCNV